MRKVIRFFSNSDFKAIIIKYDERIAGTTISVTPNGLTSLKAGNYSDTLDLVCSMQ